MADPYLISQPKRRVPLLVKILGGLVALVVLLLVVGVFAAESIINSRKDALLADVSQKIGRPVKAGKIGLSLFGGRVEVNDVVVGRDPSLPDEPDPALSLAKARVAVALWPLITSGGKDAKVKELLVEKLDAAVVRLPDGRLNWQVTADKLPKDEKPAEPPDAETRARARSAVVEQIRMNDLGVRFIDLQNKGAIVEIKDLDVALDQVSLAKAFDLKVTAAVLAPQKNFDLAAKFGPAPEQPDAIAPPRLDHATVKLAPTPLAPLAPFLAAMKGAEGLREVLAGNAQIDLDLTPGAAAPGGDGPTALKGFFALTGLKFTGGEAFDARIDSDVAAVVPAGTLDLKQLAVRLGDMGIDARGKLSDLTSGGEPQVDGFTVESRGLDFTRLHAFYPALDKTAGAVLRGPFTINARGSATEGRQRLVSTLDFTPTSIEVPGQFRKPSGTTLTLESRVTARKRLIELERAALTMAKLVVTAAGNLRIQGAGKNARQSFDGTVDIPPMAVRDLVALVAPKELASVPPVTMAAKIEAAGTVGQDETIKVKVPAFSVASGKSDLKGALSFENPSAPRVSFDGHSKYLDMDDFLPANREKKEKKEKQEEPPPILKKLTGTAKLVVDRGRAAEIDYQALKADLLVKNGRLEAKALEVDTFGGHFSGAGTELPLADPETGFVAKGEVSNLDVAAVLAQVAKKKDLLAGRLFAKVDLSGPSTRPEDVRNSLVGLLGGRVENAELLTGPILAPVVSALERASDLPIFTNTIRSARDRVAALKDRRLGSLGGALRFDDGAAALNKPLSANTPSGPLTVNGKVTLTGEADMDGELALKPEIATALTGGKARFDGPVPVALRIEGPLSNLRVRPKDAGALAKVFVTAFMKGQAGQLVSDKAKAVLDDERVKKARETADKAREQANAEAEKAKQRAAEEAEQARQRANAEAERLRKEAEERAQKAKDEAAAKAKEAAGRGLRGILGK